MQNLKHPRTFVVTALVALACCGKVEKSPNTPVITTDMSSEDNSSVDLGGERDTGQDAGPTDDAGATCAMGPENTAVACSDGCNNDGDQYIDCEDRDCCGAVQCPTGTYCGDQTDPQCATGPENTVAACNDGCSNDGDQWADCEERECCGAATGCGEDTFCGLNPRGEDTADQCESGNDNDGDGDIGCDDVSCCGVLDCAAGTTCRPTNDNNCNQGLVEFHENGSAHSSSAFVEYYTSPNGWTFSAEGGGLYWSWKPKDQSSYMTDCGAGRSQTAQSIPTCSITIEEQTWADDNGCGVIRGWFRASGDGRLTPAFYFVIPVRLTADEVAFE